ncbi:MAG: tetratricopeptide repeat protein [Caulobacterales bacterium]
MRKSALGFGGAFLSACIVAAALAPVPARAESPLATDGGRGPDSPPGVDGLPRKNTGADGLIVLPRQGETIATNMGPESMARHDACVAKADKAPKEAYEDGLVWRTEGGGALALHCVARAQLAMGDYDQAAARLDLVASMREVTSQDMRASFYAEAGHAYLLARRTADARKSFDAAINLRPQDADMRLDRAEALMLAQDWKAAVGDTDVALALRPNDTEALRLRGEAKLALRDFDGAAADANAALKADPAYVPALVLRGKVREAKAGRAVE